MKALTLIGAGGKMGGRIMNNWQSLGYLKQQFSLASFVCPNSSARSGGLGRASGKADELRQTN